MILRLRSTLHASPRCAQDERKDTRTTGGRGESSRAWSIVPENGAFKVFKKPAPSAPSAPVKAERGAVQLWEAVHFREILSAPLLHRFCTASAPSAPSALFSALWAGFWRRVGCGLLRFVIMMSMPGSLDCRARGEGYEEVGPVFFRGPQRDHRHASREERAESR